MTTGKGIIGTFPSRRSAHVDSSTARDTSYRTVICVSPDHPCLRGHFPGHPLVPGVLVLEHVARALRTWRNQRMVRVREAKFLAPLHPQETAELELADRAGCIRFELRRDGAVLARGAIEGDA